MEEIDNEGFKYFNIYIDTKNLEKQLESYKIKDKKELYIKSINKAKETLQKLLKVKSLEIDFNFEDDLLIYNGLDDWDKEKFGTKAYEKGINFFSLGIDLVIFPILEEMESGILASAFPSITNGITGQPISGIVYINTNLDSLTENFEEFFQSVLIHEFTHILGCNSDHFYYYLNIVFIKNDTYYINSKRVLQIVKNILIVLT